MNLKLKRNLTVEKVLLIIAIIGLSAIFLYFYNAQIHSTSKQYWSDISSHIRIATSGNGYSILYRIIEILHYIFKSTFPIAVLETIISIGTWLISAKFIDSLYKRNDYFISAIISFPSIFITGICIPKIYNYFYLRQIVSQPHHNITYSAMRLLAVIAMLVFFKIFESYLDKISWKQWILLALSLALSTSVKPSFFYGFALTLLIFLIIDFVRTKFKLKPFSKMVALGCVVFPSLFVMLYQSMILYNKPVEDGGSGISLVWGKLFFGYGLTQTALKLFCGLAFPTLVAIFNRKKLFRTERFIYLMYAIQLAICIIFTETGPRATHGNFYWGLYGAAFFLFLISLSRFADNLINYKNKNKLYLIIGTILLISHLLSGAVYFRSILLGAYCLK